LSFRLLTTDLRKNGLESATRRSVRRFHWIQPYLSPSGFSVVSTDRRELACWRIRRKRVGKIRSHTSNETVFPASGDRTACGSARSHNIFSLPSSASLKVFPHASFWTIRLDGPDGSKTSLRAVDVGVALRCARARRVRVFCFAGTTSPEELFVSFLPLASFSSFSFYEKRSVPASLRKLFNSWRKYDTSESTEASVKEHGNAFCPCFLLASLPSRLEHVLYLLRNRQNYVLYVDNWFVEI